MAAALTQAVLYRGGVDDGMGMEGMGMGICMEGVVEQPRLAALKLLATLPPPPLPPLPPLSHELRVGEPLADRRPLEEAGPAI